MNIAGLIRGMAIFLGGICVLAGLIDLAEQHKLGEELQWTIPIIIIGFGVGLPMIFIPISNLFESNETGEFGSDSRDSGSGDGD